MLLLAHVLGYDREWIVAHSEFNASPEQTARFAALCKRRAAGVPIAYLLGSVHFYGRPLLVDESVLVPRPETEHLIDEVIAFARKPTRVLDVGTGSGAIACTLAAETGARVDATDISAAAIEVATKNAQRLGVAELCRFYLGDLAAPVSGNRYDVIIANLPYIPTADLPRPPDPASFEPREAVDGGPDGLQHYRRLAPALQTLINEGGMVLLEAAPPTIRPLAELVRTALPAFTISVHSDYARLARYVKARP
jgi:release factor glutamine methyltransferase